MTCLRLFFSFFLLLTITFGHSQPLQRQDTIKMICREWKFKEGYSDNLDNNSQEAKDFIKYARYLFKADMTFIEKDGEWSESGKWKFNSAKKEIILESKDGTKTIFKIILLLPSMMKFESIDPDTKVFSSGTLIPSG